MSERFLKPGNPVIWSFHLSSWEKLGLTYSGLNLNLLVYFLDKIWVMQNVKCNHTVHDSQLSVKLVSARFLTRNFMEFNSLVSPGRSTYVAFSWKLNLRHCQVEHKFHKSPFCFSEHLLLLQNMFHNPFSWFIVEECSRLILWRPRIWPRLCNLYKASNCYNICFSVEKRCLLRGHEFESRKLHGN